jgi:hypothetical protein
MTKYKTLNTATIKFIEWLEAEIFARSEKLIVVNAPRRAKTTGEKSSDIAKNFAKVERENLKKKIKKTAAKVKKLKKVNENERKFWE